MPVQISIDNKIFTVDGEDAPLLREAVASMIKEAETNKTKADQAETKLTALTAEKQAAEAKATKLDAELATTKTQLTEAQKTQTKTDSGVDISQLIEERSQLWAEVLPALQRTDAAIKPDFKMTDTEIKVYYLVKAHADNKDIIDGIKERKDGLKSGDAMAKLYVDTLYTALKPKEGDQFTQSHTDSVLDMILAGRNFTTDSGNLGGGKVIDYRAELTKKIEGQGQTKQKA